MAPILELLRGPPGDFVAALLCLELGFTFDWLQRHEFGQARREDQSAVMPLVHPELGCYLLVHVHIEERFGKVVVFRTRNDPVSHTRILKVGGHQDIGIALVFVVVAGVYHNFVTCVKRCG